MRSEPMLGAPAAPFWRRFLADVIDLAVLALLCWGLWLAGLTAPAKMPPQRYDWIDYTAELIATHGHLFIPSLIVLMTAGFIYGILCHTIFERTLGGFLLGLRLVAADGAPAGPVRALLHGVGTVLALLPLALGYNWAAVSRRRQGLAEALSGTVLIVGLPRPHRT